MEYIYFIFFLFGLVIKIYKRFVFEKNKSQYEKSYISLYRENNLLWIIIFLALSVDFGIKIAERILGWQVFCCYTACLRLKCLLFQYFGALYINNV